MQPSNPETDRLIYLLEARVFEQISPEEAAELYVWGDLNPGNRQFLEEFGSLEQLIEILQKRKPIDTEAALLRVKVQNTRVRPNRSIGVISLHWWKYAAAAVVLLLSLSYWFVRQRPQERLVSQSVTSEINPGGNKAMLTLSDGRVINLDEARMGTVAEQVGMKINKTSEGQLVYQAGKSVNGPAGVWDFNKISTPRAGQYKVNLPDGTRVWLNALSSIRFPAVFGPDERRVEMTGEAYFEVAKSQRADHRLVPFRVVSKGQLIEVTGTHFNVNAYQDERAITTTLLEGSVKVLQTMGGRHPGVRLKPGEQSVIEADKLISVRRMDPEGAVAWKDGYFRYNKTDIGEVMRQMSRWYDIDVYYQDKIMPTDRFTGFVSRSVTLGNALKMLEEVGSVKFTIEGKKVLVKSIE